MIHVIRLDAMRFIICFLRVMRDFLHDFIIQGRQRNIYR